MIESLLELSRVRSGHERVCDTSFPPRACVEEVAERLRAVAAHRNVGIRVSWDCADVAVAGDENRLRQVFANLIGNDSRTLSRCSNLGRKSRESSPPCR
jgi:signal transduction histidine kinase